MQCNNTRAQLALIFRLSALCVFVYSLLWMCGCVDVGCCLLWFCSLFGSWSVWTARVHTQKLTEEEHLHVFCLTRLFSLSRYIEQGELHEGGHWIPFVEWVSIHHPSTRPDLSAKQIVTESKHTAVLFCLFFRCRTHSTSSPSSYLNPPSCPPSLPTLRRLYKTLRHIPHFHFLFFTLRSSLILPSSSTPLHPSSPWSSSLTPWPRSLFWWVSPAQLGPHASLPHSSLQHGSVC